jgi:hypothetical protein
MCFWTVTPHWKLSHRDKKVSEDSFLADWEPRVTGVEWMSQ